MSKVIGELDEIIHELNVQRTCIRCRAFYSEMDSMGSLQCQWHPGMLQTVTIMYGGKADTYSCCSVSPFGAHTAYRGEQAAKGCTRCDHTSDAGIPSNITMPTERADVLFGNRLQNRSVLYNAANSDITIIRRQPLEC